MHTPEPWHLQPLGKELYIEAEGPKFICDMQRFVGAIHDPTDPSEVELQANAKRIVDCVNGCEGINPEAVKDLLAACFLAVNFIRKQHQRAGSPMDEETFIVDDELTAAIAKAEQKC